MDHIVLIDVRLIPVPGADLQLIKNGAGVPAFSKICRDHISHHRLSKAAGTDDTDIFSTPAQVFSAAACSIVWPNAWINDRDQFIKNCRFIYKISGIGIILKKQRGFFAV